MNQKDDNPTSDAAPKSEKPAKTGKPVLKKAKMPLDALVEELAGADHHEPAPKKDPAKSHKATSSAMRAFGLTQEEESKKVKALKDQVDKAAAGTVHIGDETGKWRPKLVDILDINTLQEIQDSFTAVTRLETIIRDEEGVPLTNPSDPDEIEARGTEPQHLLSSDDDSLSTAFIAPIMVDDEELGFIEIARNSRPSTTRTSRVRLREFAEALGVEPGETNALVDAAEASCGPNKAAGVELLYLLANTLTQICLQEYQSREQLKRLTALYELSTALERIEQLQEILDMAVRTTARVMGVRACSIALRHTNRKEMIRKAVHGLSKKYLNKGALNIAESPMLKQALDGEIVIIENMQDDERVIYKQEAAEEGIVTCVCAPLIYQTHCIGTLHLFTRKERTFAYDEIELLRAITQQLAGVIENAQLNEEKRNSERIQRQVSMAQKVQGRLLPREIPKIPGAITEARYEPTHELAGDFYDLLSLEKGNKLGIAIGDVMGKGVAAGLLMASVRSSLRAFAKGNPPVNQVMRNVNRAMVRDTTSGEFASLFYGVFDPTERTLTYCNAGHPTPLLVRDGKIIKLKDADLLIGIDKSLQFTRLQKELRKGDLLLFYTDGLTDAENYDGERYGLNRLGKALLDPRAQGAKVTADYLLWDIKRFAGLKDQTDDITHVLLEITE